MGILLLSWLALGVAGGVAGVSTSFALTWVPGSTTSDLKTLFTIGVLGGYLIGALVFIYTFYCHARTVDGKLCFGIATVVVLLSTIVLSWPTERQLAWAIGLFFGLVIVAPITTLSIVSSAMYKSLRDAARALWIQSCILAGGLTAYIMFWRLAAPGPPVFDIAYVSALYKGLGVAVGGGLLAGFILWNVIDRIADRTFGR